MDVVDYGFSWHVDGDNRTRSRHAVFNINIQAKKVTPSDIEYVFNSLKRSVLDVSAQSKVQFALLEFAVNKKESFVVLINANHNYDDYTKFVQYRFCVAERQTAESKYLEAKRFANKLKQKYVASLVEETNACDRYLGNGEEARTIENGEQAQ